MPDREPARTEQPFMKSRSVAGVGRPWRPTFRSQRGGVGWRGMVVFLAVVPCERRLGLLLRCCLPILSAGLASPSAGARPCI
jgi:hypothetical protein